MNESDLLALSARIGRLERQNARLKWLGGSMLLGLLALLALGGVPEARAQRDAAVKGLRARNFVAVDARDRELVRFGTDIEAKSGGLMEFLDKAGKRRVLLGVGEGDIPFVSLIDPARDEQVTLNLDPAKGMALSFRNRKANSGVLLGLSSEGDPSFGFMGQGGKAVMNLGVNLEGSALMILRDKDGKEVVQIPAAAP